VLSAITWPLQRPGYIHGTVKASAWIVAIAAELLLAIGGYTDAQSASSTATGSATPATAPQNVKDGLTPTLTTDDGPRCDGGPHHYPMSQIIAVAVV
jgi:hypothetical protein